MYTTDEIRKLIACGEVEKFYKDLYWRNLSRTIIKEQHNECQLCKKKGKYSRAVLTHHVKPLKDFPELAYERYQDADGKELQLVALCQMCHEEEHDRCRFRGSGGFTNPERW